MDNLFSNTVTDILAISKNEALRLNSNVVTPTHIMLSIIKHDNNSALVVLIGQQANINRIKNDLEQSANQQLEVISQEDNNIQADKELSKILKLCVLEARIYKSHTIEATHLLLAILRERTNSASQILKANNITYDNIAMSLKERGIDTTKSNFTDGQSNIDEEDDGENLIKANIHNNTESIAINEAEKDTPVLNNFGTDLTNAAKEGLLDPVIGREKEIERVSQILCKRKKNNPILIGEPGVGKSAIVEGLAQKIINHTISRSLWHKRVFMLDMGSIVAGTKYRGQFEERIRSIISELQHNKDIIIFIDEIHTIIGAGSAEGTMDAANLLKPALARGEIQCIGATTLEEYHKSFEKDGALERRFQKVLVEQTTPDETIEILNNLKRRYEEHHNVQYTDEAIKACVSYSERYITDRCFPDKAIDVMDEVGSRTHIKQIKESPEVVAQEQVVKILEKEKINAVKSQNFELAADYRDKLNEAEQRLASLKKSWEIELKDNKLIIDEVQVAEVVSIMTGIPVNKIDKSENQRLKLLSESLKKNVIGQDNAVDKVAKSIQRSRLGLRDPNKPIGAFMFVGPTGVGKTHLAKRLAEELFGSEQAIIRIDMSEYGDKYTVSRMVGAPPGYVGYDEGGQLTEKVKRHPYSIILLDEIEKAHHDVFNILLQIMDDGRLTDGNGVTIDFKNTILIMTSNCGTRQLKDFGKGIGFSSDKENANDKHHAEEIIKKSLTKEFAPEFLNRLDEIIFFEQLKEDSIRKIVDIELQLIIERVSEIGYSLKVSKAVKEWVSTKGYSIENGARPLKRIIQTNLEDAICEAILNDDMEKDGKILKAELNNDNIVIKQV